MSEVWKVGREVMLDDTPVYEIVVIDESAPGPPFTTLIGWAILQDDAHKIAAAPEMYEALKELYAAWEGYEMLAALDIAIQRKADAALAKADGND